MTDDAPTEAQFPAALMDVKTAIRFFRAHAREYNLDPAHIASWGSSAGGYLAVMAGLTPFTSMATRASVWLMTM